MTISVRLILLCCALGLGSVAARAADPAGPGPVALAPAGLPAFSPLICYEVIFPGAVTPAEREHGHRITYSLDTLERDAVRGGLAVRHRSGIFFKALANFQWDRLLQTDIVSPAYLDGCFALGQQYPDLCASIFLMCEAGARNDQRHGEVAA